MKLLSVLNFLQVLTGVILLFLAIYTYPNKKSKLNRSLVSFLLLTGWWCLCSFLLMKFGSFEDKILINRIKFLSPIFLPPVIFSLALDLNGEIKFNKFLTFLPSIVFSCVMFSPWHELFVYNYSFIKFLDTDLLTYSYGPVFQIHNISSRFFCLASFYVIIRGMKGRHKTQKLTGWILIASILIPLIVDTIAANFYEPFRYLQLVSVTLGFTGVLMAYALFVHDFLGLAPYTRSQVVSHLSEACLMWDSEGILIDCNEAAEKLLKINGDIRTFDFSRHSYLKQNEKEFEWEKGQFFKVKYEIIRDSSGIEIGAFTLLNDISSLKRVEEKLLTINHVKTNILGVLSHDLCGHAGQLNLVSELLMADRKNLSDKEQEELIECTYALSKDLNLFLGNLLEWSKDQFQDWDIKKEEFPVRDLINETWTFLSQAAVLKNQTLVNEVTHDLLIYTDKRMLEIIIRNLLYNAIKHSPINSVIKTQLDDNKLSFINQSVINSSDVALINKYFEDGSTDTAPHGGLGHKLCKEFSKILGMNISVFQKDNDVTFMLSY